MENIMYEKIDVDNKKNIFTDTNAQRLENFKSICSLIPNKHEFYASSANGEYKTLNQFKKKFEDGEIKDINAQDTLGWSFLHYAVARNNIEAINFIIKNGGNIEIKNIDGETPLFTATVLENIEAIKALLKLNANVDTRNKAGMHLLYLAEHKRNPKIGEILSLEQRKKYIDIYSNPKGSEMFKRLIQQEVLKRIK